MMDWDKIVLHAMEVLSRKGKGNDSIICCCKIGVPGIEYEDDVLRIAMNIVTGELEVIRLENKNPVIYSKERGEKLRFHGEFHKIEDHFFSL